VGADGAATLDDADVGTQPVGASLRVEIVALLEAVPVLVAFVGADGPVPAIRALLADGRSSIRRRRPCTRRPGARACTAPDADRTPPSRPSYRHRRSRRSRPRHHLLRCRPCPGADASPMTAISPSAGVVAADQGQSENAHHEEPQGKTLGASVSPPVSCITTRAETATSGHKKKNGRAFGSPALREESVAPCPPARGSAAGVVPAHDPFEGRAVSDLGSVLVSRLGLLHAVHVRRRIACPSILLAPPIFSAFRPWPALGATVGGTGPTLRALVRGELALRG